MLDPFQVTTNVPVADWSSPQHVKLHFDADERLDRRVVQFACDARALNRPNS
jgi:hypothetical protein